MFFFGTELHVSTMNEATYDDLTSPAQMSDPLNTTNSESKYI